jgi:chemotaxis response regulator CheB
MAEEGHMIEPMVIAQHPASAAHASMPAAAVRSGAVDFVLPLREIGPALDAIVRGRPLHV